MVGDPNAATTQLVDVHDAGVATREFHGLSGLAVAVGARCVRNENRRPTHDDTPVNAATASAIDTSTVVVLA